MNLYPRPRRYPYQPIARKPWPRDMPGVYLDDFHLNVPPPLATVVMIDPKVTYVDSSDQWRTWTYSTLILSAGAA